MTVLLYAVAGFLLGGAISVWRGQGTRHGRLLAVVLALGAALAVAGGVLNG